MTAIPCGQKNNSSEVSHSQIVTPPFAAMEGTTLRLKTATTNSRTRSQRPRTRFRCGCSASWFGSDKSRSRIQVSKFQKFQSFKGFIVSGKTFGGEVYTAASPVLETLPP